MGVEASKIALPAEEAEVSAGPLDLKENEGSFRYGQQ